MTKIKCAVVCLVSVSTLTACGSNGSGSADAYSRDQAVHQEMKIVDPASDGSSQSAGTVAAQAITIGSVYLETQIAPLTVTGTTLQASDVSTNGSDAYVTYSAKDPVGQIIKKGAVEHLTATSCDNVLTPRKEYCLSSKTNLVFPDADLFAVYADGTSVWAAGSTSDESVDGKYARIYKMNLNATKDPASIAVTRALASYAGTGITKIGTQLLVTTGTSLTAPMMGGLEVMNPDTLAAVNMQPLYDARSVAVDPSNSAQAFVVRGGVSSASPGVVSVLQADGAQPVAREIATGGNYEPESKSSVQVGQQLVLTSLGAQGFRVSCKANGNSLAVVPAPILAGVDAKLTVTNSVLAIQGYILAANGEAGAYLYQFQKKTAASTNLCVDGVTVTLVGRLSLSAGAYVNGELSANSIKYMPLFDLLNLNVLAAKLVVISSGNKGISLINLGALTVSLIDVDDF